MHGRTGQLGINEIKLRDDVRAKVAVGQARDLIIQVLAVPAHGFEVLYDEQRTLADRPDIPGVQDKVHGYREVVGIR